MELNAKELQQYREDIARWKSDQEATPRRVVESGLLREGDPHPQAMLRQAPKGRRNLFGGEVH